MKKAVRGVLLFSNSLYEKWWIAGISNSSFIYFQLKKNPSAVTCCIYIMSIHHLGLSLHGRCLPWLGRYCFCIYFYNCSSGSPASHQLCAEGVMPWALTQRTKCSACPRRAGGVLLVQPPNRRKAPARWNIMFSVLIPIIYMQFLMRNC